MMPYRSKEDDREWHKNYMRLKRSVTPPLLHPVTPNLETKLSEAGLTVGKDGLLDLTGSIVSPLKEETNSRVPIYNRRIHKPGDRVIKDGQEVIVPVLDGEGNSIPEFI